MKKYILALDQGTTSSRAVIFDRDGNTLSMYQKEFPQIFPRDGWVEHNPDDIINTQIDVAREAMASLGINASEIAAAGITNQRETVIVWDRSTGKPIYNAVVWQCRRTASYCEELRKQNLGEYIREKTGLVTDPYFSASKLKWILDNVDGARTRAENGDFLFGTVDSWLIYNLTGGKVHATDYTNASRTMLFNINTLTWDEDLLRLFDIPRAMLPEILPSSGIFGYTDKSIFGKPIAIAGVAGDQQAALFGQCCHDAGEVKNTYGTGGFMLMNTGKKPIFSKNGLLTTVGCLCDGKPGYVLEGSVFICGAAIQWLRDGLGIIKSASESEVLASAVNDSGGVYFVPALVGLGAPYWDPYARGTVIGITRSTTKNHIVRAALEAMAYQTADILALMQEELGVCIKTLAVDGGACANNLLMQIQADIIGHTIIRPECVETTALGAAQLAALAVGYYDSADEIHNKRRVDREFIPSTTDKERTLMNERWHKAVSRSLDFGLH